MHNLFHVTMFKGYVSDESHVLGLSPMELQKDLSYEEKQVAILDRRENALRNTVIPVVKVVWRNHKIEEVT